MFKLNSVLDYICKLAKRLMGPTLFDRDEANREKSRGIVKEQ